MKKEKSFLRGYLIVFHSFVSYWIYGTLLGGGLSVIVAQYCNMTGLDTNLITSVNTIGGFVSVVMTFVIGRTVARKRIRNITVFSCMGTALGLYILANGSTLGMYILYSAITQGLYNGYSFTASNALIANWFPRKKGIIMGITTAGMMAASFISVLFMTVFSPKLGFSMVCYIFAVVILAFGLLFIATTGGITAFIPYMMERGYSSVSAVGLMSWTSILLLVGSLIIGAIDSKFGTKKASILFASLYTFGYLGVFAFRNTEILYFVPMFLFRRWHGQSNR